ncbi:hypothetical protein ABPG72_004463 [Tetrahymena utriculariae]
MSKFFSGLFNSFIKHQTPIEKAFKNTCFLKENFDEIDYDDLLKVLSFLNGKTEIKQQEAIHLFFQYFKDNQDLSLQRRLKFLALIHKSIKKIGFDFAEEFLSIKPNCLREKTSPSQLSQKQTKQKQMVFHYMDIESWLEEYLIKHYYDYLMRMSLNLETYKTCMQGCEKDTTPNNHSSQNGDMQQYFSQQQQQQQNQFKNGNNQMNNTLKIIILFKVNNLVNFLIKLQKQFYIIFTEFKFISIAKDIAYMVLKDCIIYYNYMHKQIMQMVNNYESMLEQDQMQFYELFIELIKLNSALHDFGKLKKFFDEEDSIEQPLTLNITKERARQIDRNHRKIVLRNEEIQRDRKLKLQKMQSADNGQGSLQKTFSTSSYGKRLGVFPKGSMTSRCMSWKPNEQICEVTNDDEDDEAFKSKFKINSKKGLHSHQQSLINGVSELRVPNLHLEHMYGNQNEYIDYSNGYNTDRIMYRGEKDTVDEDKSESTKETKKDDTFNNKNDMKE